MTQETAILLAFALGIACASVFILVSERRAAKRHRKIMAELDKIAR